ncbi:MAG: MFS transporter [Saccharopolyspora sp.]|nr:MFS transporter [Saccharopolyspora sp.]
MDARSPGHRTARSPAEVKAGAEVTEPNHPPNGAAPAPPAVRRKAVLAASIGNFVEWFEFTLYGFFAAAIAVNFFPVPDGTSSLIPTFAAFGISFVLRPLGALVFGHFGDRLGRRGTLAASLIGMSAATFVIGVLPNADTIGVLAPILLIVARVAQGFSAGGEFGGATAYMVEYAPEHRRNFFGSWQFFTQMLAGLAGSAVGASLSAVLSEQALNAWGWRIPFLLTLPLGVIGFYLRLRLDETPQFKAEQGGERGAPLPTVLREHWPNVLKVIGLMITGTTFFYMVQAFFPAFLVEQVGLARGQMFAAMMIGICAQLVLIPLWALYADRIGRRRPMLVGSLAVLVVCAVPTYLLFLHGTFGSAALGYLVLAVVLAPMTGCLATALAESFPTSVRYSGLSVAYSVSVSVFGGFTPLILSALAASGRLAPAYYLVGAAVLSLMAALLLPESAQSSDPASDRDGAAV